MPESGFVERVRAARAAKAAIEDKLSMRPSTVQEPDRITFYCDVKTRRFTMGCCKILQAYANGDCRVLAPNGVQFTARAEEIFYIRKGDYHEAVSL